MQLRNDQHRYGAVAQAFHWAVAVLVVVMFGLAWYMTGLPLSPEKAELYNLHKSIGLTVLVLVVLRLLWRWANPVPPLPPGRPRHERLAARLSHALLYLLLFAQPLSGLVLAWASEFPSEIYGLVTLPDPIGTDKALQDTMAGVHGAIAWAILVLVAVHAAAALRHHLVLKDDVLRRMLPGRRA